MVNAPPEITLSHLQCAVGDIHRCKMAPSNFWVASSLFENVGRGMNEPYDPKSDCWHQSKMETFDCEDRRMMRTFLESNWPRLFKENFKKLTKSKLLYISRPEDTRSFRSLKFLHLPSVVGGAPYERTYTMAVANTRGEKNMNHIKKEIE